MNLATPANAMTSNPNTLPATDDEQPVKNDQPNADDTETSEDSDDVAQTGTDLDFQPAA